MVSSGVDEVVIRASLVRLSYRQLPARAAIAMLRTVAADRIVAIFNDLPVSDGNEAVPT